MWGEGASASGNKLARADILPAHGVEIRAEHSTVDTHIPTLQWAATLLQSSNVAWQYGVSGPFWYASGATIQVLLFGILAIERLSQSGGR